MCHICWDQDGLRWRTIQNNEVQLKVEGFLCNTEVIFDVFTGTQHWSLS